MSTFINETTKEILEEFRVTEIIGDESLWMEGKVQIFPKGSIYQYGCPAWVFHFSGMEEDIDEKQWTPEGIQLLSDVLYKHKAWRWGRLWTFAKGVDVFLASLEFFPKDRSFVTLTDKTIEGLAYQLDRYLLRQELHEAINLLV